MDGESYGRSDKNRTNHLAYDNQLSNITHTDSSCGFGQNIRHCTTHLSSMGFNMQLHNKDVAAVLCNESNNTTEPSYQAHQINLNISQALDNNYFKESSERCTRLTNLNPDNQQDCNRMCLNIDNPVFEEVTFEQLNNMNIFGYNNAYNSDLDSPLVLAINTSDHNKVRQSEAASLELVTSKPTEQDLPEPYETIGNDVITIPLKRGIDLGNSYDEYFVPVNEHRKYMRGEKLYVTIDKRGTKYRSKCLFWSICLSIMVTSGIIIGVLAAVGLLENQDPHTQNKINSTRPHETKSLLTNEFLFSSKVLRMEPTPLSQMNVPTNVLPLSETVPHVLESHFLIDNIQFTPQIVNKNSSEYRAISLTLERELQKYLFRTDVLNNKRAANNLKIMDLRPEGVVFRIAWKSTDGTSNISFLIDDNLLTKEMLVLLKQENGFIGPYHIPEHSLSTERIPNICKINNNGCKYICLFDYDDLEFICICPIEKYLDENTEECIRKLAPGNTFFLNGTYESAPELIDYHSNIDMTMSSLLKTNTENSVSTTFDLNEKNSYVAHFTPHYQNSAEIITFTEYFDKIKDLDHNFYTNLKYYTIPTSYTTNKEENTKFLSSNIFRLPTDSIITDTSNSPMLNYLDNPLKTNYVQDRTINLRKKNVSDASKNNKINYAYNNALSDMKKTHYVISEKKMYELGVVTLFTPEAEIYTTMIKPFLIHEKGIDTLFRFLGDENTTVINPTQKTKQNITTQALLEEKNYKGKTQEEYSTLFKYGNETRKSQENIPPTYRYLYP